MKVQKPGKSTATNISHQPPAKSIDPTKEAMTQFLCEQLQKTIQNATTQDVAEKRKERADIEQNS
jgi:hypothetical protein